MSTSPPVLPQGLSVDSKGPMAWNGTQLWPAPEPRRLRIIFCPFLLLSTGDPETPPFVGAPNVPPFSYFHTSTTPRDPPVTPRVGDCRWPCRPPDLCQKPLPQDRWLLATFWPSLSPSRFVNSFIYFSFLAFILSTVTFRLGGDES